jgi:NAD(P)-dependent dehydrogenase (short-subunit alcohol dehydrogenase family)
LDRDAEAGAAVAAEIEKDAAFRAADVARSANVRGYVEAALDAFGASDCFHRNAGIEGRVASSPCGRAFMGREREFDKLLLEAAGNGFSAASRRTAAGPSFDPGRSER